MRPYVILFIKGILTVLSVFILIILTIFAGLYKESREDNRALRARLETVSAMIPVDSLTKSVSGPEVAPDGDPYLSATEVVSVLELPQKDGDLFRYLVVEVSGNDGSPTRVSFKMKGALVADFLKRSIGCAVFR